jgi:hypothetical protein
MDVCFVKLSCGVSVYDSGVVGNVNQFMKFKRTGN